MKNKLLKLLLLIHLVGACLLPTTAFANQEYYQASSLIALENVIFQAIQDREPAFKVRYTGNTDNIKNDVKAARDNAVARDPYAESSISLISGFKISNFPTYADISFDSFQYFTTKEQEQFVEEEVTKIIGQIISSGMNDHDKEKAIHDYLLNRINYDYSLAGYTAYAALKNGVTVCNGYVQLGYKLLNQAGIETKMVKGTLESNGTPKDHAWLLVKIEGKWYHLDPTLDDTLAGDGGNPYKYYNLSDAEIMDDHSFDEVYYPAAPLKYSWPATNNVSSGSSSSSVATGYFAETTIGNQVTATLDTAKTLALLEKGDTEKVLYDLQINSIGNSYEIAVPIQVMRTLAQKNSKAVLRLRTSIGWYDLPAEGLVLSTEAIVQKDASAKFVVNINKVAGSVATAAVKASTQAGLKIVGSPISFAVEVKGNALQQAPGYHKFVARTIMLDQKISADRAVGLFYNPVSGELRPVPAVFSELSGQSTARLNYRGNGIFLVAVKSKTQFADLTGHWATDNIEKLAVKIIVKGQALNYFGPEGKVRRAEYAAMLVRALGLADSDDVTEKKAGFKDVPGGWFAESVGIASAHGLIKGYADGNFHPYAQISREEMAVMLARTMAIAGTEPFDKKGKTGNFRDQGKIGRWAEEAIFQTYQASIIQGNQLGDFMPQLSASRAEAVAMIDRMLKYIGFIN